MKITIAKLFEALQLGPEAAKLEPLVSFINGSIDQVVRALQNRLTLRDNAQCEIRDVVFRPPAVLADPITSAVLPWTAEFTPSQRTVEGILVIQTEASDGNTLASWTYAFTSKGTLSLSVFPRVSVASSKEMTIKFAVLFQ